MKYSIGSIALFGILVGCANEAPPPKAPVATSEEPSGPSRRALVDQTPGDNVASIRISDEIRRACGLTAIEAYFDFDSSRVSLQADHVLSSLATCFTTGPLKGRSMNLVGHADPRGDSEYNLVLGGRRADHVGKVLSNKGVKTARISTTSRGEMDAAGVDEMGWANDRRVEVMLAD